MFSGADRVLRRGAERWERSSRERRAETPGPADSGGPEQADENSHGRHRAPAGEKTPWQRRPRARLNSGLHRLYLTTVFAAVGLLAGGASTVVSAPSLMSRVGGGLAVIAGAVLVWLVVLYLRRPVAR